jgi:adenine C2-methylase RlmN of 23S rRNA A2503 and tRNA A37
MDIERVRAVLNAHKAPVYRLDQVQHAIFRESAGSYEEISVLPLGLRRVLTDSSPFLSLKGSQILISKDSRAHKAVLALQDGRRIETVLLRPSPHRWTTCISCQVGCGMGCTFCATGLMGFHRNLTPEEITDQVLFWRLYMNQKGFEGRLDNVVYMGMGEPFAAYENVSRSLRILMDQRQFSIGARHIAVSTAGIVPQMERFAQDFPQINLALSLHAVEDSLRERLVPLNKVYPLKSLAGALKAYLAHCSRKVFLEYVLLRGENDRRQDACNLIAFIKGIGLPERLHVNLIVFNQTQTAHQATPEENARSFQRLLRQGGLCATVRQNLGRDIQGACGQLIVEEPKT